jgi:hypothetical protein
MEYFKLRNLQKLKNKYEEPYDMVKNYKSSRYDKENIYKMLDSFFTKKMIKDYNLKQLKVFKQQNNFPLIKTDKNNDIKLFKDLTNPLNLIRQISEDREEKFIKKLEEDKKLKLKDNEYKLAIKDIENKLALKDIENNNKINSLRDLNTLALLIDKKFNELEERNDLTDEEINNIKNINIKKLINDSLDNKGLNSKDLIQNINEQSIASIKPLITDIINNALKDIELVKRPGRKTNLELENIKLKKENDALKKLLPEGPADDDIEKEDEKDDDIEEKDGSGLFDTIKTVIKNVLPSVKTILKKPEVQKKALELGTDFIKNKFKKKEPIKLTEQEELFKMFKNKEITLQEYKELRSLNNNEIKSEIKNIKTEDKDSNLKNLSGDYKPHKIYLDLLNKKHISPEKYLELTTGKIPNLSKPIRNEIKEEIKEEIKPNEIKQNEIEPKAEGLKKKRKYIRKK